MVGVYIVPAVAADTPTLCNGRSAAVRQDLQSFFDALENASPITPETIGRAFYEFGLSELLFCFDFEDSEDLYDLIMQHVFGTLHQVTEKERALLVLLVLHCFQVCAGPSFRLKVTLADLQRLATLAKHPSQEVKEVVRRILSDAEICLYSSRFYLDNQGRRLLVTDDGTIADLQTSTSSSGVLPPSVVTGRAVKTVIGEGGVNCSVINADTNTEIFNQQFMHKHNIYNEIFPLVKDLNSLLPPPIHNPFASTAVAAGVAGSGGHPDSTGQTQAVSSSGRRRPGGVSMQRQLAYKLQQNPR